VITDYRIYRS